MGSATPGASDVLINKAFTYGVLSGATPFGAVTFSSGGTVPQIMLRLV